MYKQKVMSRVVHNSVTQTTQGRLLGIKGWDGDNIKEAPFREKA